MLGIIENYNGVFIVVIFVLLFAVIWNLLKRSSIIPENICLVLALCVSALCIIGLFDLGKTETKLITDTKTFLAKDTPPAPPTPPAETDKKKINFILLPYAALAISILLAFILSMLLKTWSGIKGFFGSLRHRTDKRTIMTRRFTKSPNPPHSVKKQKWNIKLFKEKKL